MKLPPLLLALTLSAATLASAGLGPIDLVIDQAYKTDSEKNSDTQNKSLKITVINNSRQDLPGLNVKYYFFARDLESHDLSMLDKGEVTAEVKAVSKTQVETKTVTAKSTPTKGKKKASGTKIMGYALRVFDSTGKVLAERYEPLTLQQELAKTDPLPKTP